MCSTHGTKSHTIENNRFYPLKQIFQTVNKLIQIFSLRNKYFELIEQIQILCGIQELITWNKYFLSDGTNIDIIWNKNSYRVEQKM